MSPSHGLDSPSRMILLRKRKVKSSRETKVGFVLLRVDSPFIPQYIPVFLGKILKWITMAEREEDPLKRNMNRE